MNFLASNRTTIVASDILMERVEKYCKDKGITQTEFYNKAILNQLENEGDFSIRDELEAEEKEDKEEW